MSEESKIISSFSLQETLNPKIWDNYANPKKASLKPEIRKKLLEIAHEFMDFIDVEFFVDDIIFTGSLSNFNWSDFSDVDLHLEVEIYYVAYVFNIIKDNLIKPLRSIYNNLLLIQIFRTCIEYNAHRTNHNFLNNFF